MRLLLDTHVVLWLLTDDTRLGPAARTRITNRESECYVSAASWWELAIKQSRDATRLPMPLADVRTTALQAGIREVSVTPQHALGVLALPALHRDPFDRMLIVQAITEPYWLVTADAQVIAYETACSVSLVRATE